MTLLLLIACAAFTAVALFTPLALRTLTRSRRLRHPHGALVLIFRLWFAALALATLWLLFLQARLHR